MRIIVVTGSSTGIGCTAGVTESTNTKVTKITKITKATKVRRPLQFRHFPHS